MKHDWHKEEETAVGREPGPFGEGIGRTKTRTVYRCSFCDNTCVVDERFGIGLALSNLDSDCPGPDRPVVLETLKG